MKQFTCLVLTGENTHDKMCLCRQYDSTLLHEAVSTSGTDSDRRKYFFFLFILGGNTNDTLQCVCVGSMTALCSVKLCPRLVLTGGNTHDKMCSRGQYDSTLLHEALSMSAWY